MDASIAATLPSFLVSALEAADEVFEQTPVGGTPGEDVAILARIGSTMVAVSSHDSHLDWVTLDSEEEAIAAFAAQAEAARRIIEYASRPDANPIVVTLMAAHGMPVEIAERLAQRLGGLAEAPQAVRAIGRAPVPTGTVYQAASEPHTGMYL